MCEVKQQATERRVSVWGGSSGRSLVRGESAVYVVRSVGERRWFSGMSMRRQGVQRRTSRTSRTSGDATVRAVRIKYNATSE